MGQQSDPVVKHDRVVKVLVTGDQRRQLGRAARRAGRTLSSWCRSAIASALAAQTND